MSISAIERNYRDTCLAEQEDGLCPICTFYVTNPSRRVSSNGGIADIKRFYMSRGTRVFYDNWLLCLSRAFDRACTAECMPVVRCPPGFAHDLRRTREWMYSAKYDETGDLNDLVNIGLMPVHALNTLGYYCTIEPNGAPNNVVYGKKSIDELKLLVKMVSRGQCAMAYVLVNKPVSVKTESVSVYQRQSADLNLVLVVPKHHCIMDTSVFVAMKDPTLPADWVAEEADALRFERSRRLNKLFVRWRKTRVKPVVPVLEISSSTRDVSTVSTLSDSLSAADVNRDDSPDAALSSFNVDRSVQQSVRGSDEVLSDTGSSGSDPWKDLTSPPLEASGGSEPDISADVALSAEASPDDVVSSSDEPGEDVAPEATVAKAVVVSSSLDVGNSSSPELVEGDADHVCACLEEAHKSVLRAYSLRGMSSERLHVHLQRISLYWNSELAKLREMLSSGVTPGRYVLLQLFKDNHEIYVLQQGKILCLLDANLVLKVYTLYQPRVPARYAIPRKDNILTATLTSTTALTVAGEVYESCRQDHLCDYQSLTWFSGITLDDLQSYCDFVELCVEFMRTGPLMFSTLFCDGMKFILVDKSRVGPDFVVTDLDRPSSMVTVRLFDYRSVRSRLVKVHYKRVKKRWGDI